MALMARNCWCNRSDCATCCHWNGWGVRLHRRAADVIASGRKERRPF